MFFYSALHYDVKSTYSLLRLFLFQDILLKSGQYIMDHPVQHFFICSNKLLTGLNLQTNNENI
jgi:hypothetical protein